MESSLARLRLEPNFFIIALKARAEKISRLDLAQLKKIQA
jgi:hypothetical protein